LIARAGSYAVARRTIETYTRDGAVLLEQPFAPEWIDGLVEAFAEIERDHAAGRFLGDIFHQDGRLEISGAVGAHAFVRRWALESQAAEIVARVIGSSRIRLYTNHDIAFGKRGAAESARIGATAFHIDASAWEFRGAMVPSFWLALTDVGNDFGPLVVAAGSHRRLDRLILPSPNDPAEPVPAGYAPYAAMQSFLDEHDFEMKLMPAQRGDVVVLHPHVAHGSIPMQRAGNRLAFSTRWLGDDARWHLNANTRREGDAAGVPADDSPPDDARFPVIWDERLGPRGASPEVERVHAFATAQPKFRYREYGRVETQDYLAARELKSC
jgi:ectoine hydroxylase-related dioxygenase (phytanoyl-CoA dioxygenase family)